MRQVRNMFHKNLSLLHTVYGQRIRLSNKLLIILFYIYLKNCQQVQGLLLSDITFETEILYRCG